MLNVSIVLILEVYKYQISQYIWHFPQIEYKIGREKKNFFHFQQIVSVLSLRRSKYYKSYFIIHTFYMGVAVL